MSRRPLERTFDVGGGDPGRFVEYIRELREDIIRELREEDSTSRAPPLPNDVQVLAPQRRQGPRQWLRLRMVAPGGAEIILWIRMDNLYLVGFEQPQSQPQLIRRYEFNNSTTSAADSNDDKTKKKKKDKDKNAIKKLTGNQGGGQQQRREPLIRNASFLGIEGGYEALGLRDNNLHTIEFGYHPLVNAIYGLARYVRGAAGGVGRDHLRTMIVTICESLRLHDVCQFFGQLLSNQSQGHLTLVMFNRMQHWGAISACVLVACANSNNASSTTDQRYRRFINDCQIENTDQACQVLALLKNPEKDHEDDKNNKGGKSRPKRDDDEAAALDVPQLELAWQGGLTFVEIFSAVVAVQGIHNHLYGHIAIDDGFTSQQLFMRRSSNAQLPSPDGHVELTGPARAVWGYDEIVMHVDLMEAVPGAVADMTPDGDEVGSGKLVWNTYDTPGMVYDEVEEYVFEGVSGAVNVRCAVITNAVVATVALRRTGTGRGRGRPPEVVLDVYGTVSAGTAMFLPRDMVTLFNRERKDAFSVGGDEDVPLLRNVAVVPLGSPLVISADLWTRAYVVDMSPDDHIISSGAVAVFEPYPFGVFRKVITGGSNDNYEFEVSVTWSLN